MARRPSSFFSPPSRHPSHTARRRSLPSHGAGASPSSTPWSRRETAQLVAAWRDVAEHPASARESVDAFQTRLFLRFQEVVAGDTTANDDTVSMAGSECSMESVEFTSSSSSTSSSGASIGGSSGGSSGGSGALFAARARTQTAVVLRTYALRRMAGFITAFLAQQAALKQQHQQQQQAMEDVGDVDVAASQEEVEAPVDWFALSRNSQIERFQAAGATGYIELDEHMYETILTTLELQDRCKQEKEAPSSSPASGGGLGGSGNVAAVAADAQSSLLWTEQEVRHVLTAWRETHMRTPTRLRGADSFYARFLALNGETSQRSKPEVANMKSALLHMHGVVTAFHNRAPANGKLTRGNLRRQRQSWFALSFAERQRVFSESGGSHLDCGFVDISEDMYATISELASTSPSSSLAMSFWQCTGDSLPESGKRRSSFGASTAVMIKSEDTSTAEQMLRSSKRENIIDLISDDECDDEQASSVQNLSQSGVGDDVDMGEEVDASAEAGDSSSLDNSSSKVDEGKSRIAQAVARAQAASEATTKLFADLKTDLRSSTENGAVKDQRDADEHTDVDENSRVRQNSLKKQKLEHYNNHDATNASEMAALLEKQAQELNALVLQVQEDREREREEREKLLLAMKVDQQGRDAVVELLLAEQEERRRDREERRQMLQLLMREQQELQCKQAVNGTSAAEYADAKYRVKNEL